MYSVIIPTMHKCDRFFTRFVYDLDQCDYVDEIILIDNAPNLYQTITINKLTYLPQDDNIGVNPAWNLGANVARNDRLCFLNDDLIFDLRIFSRVDQYLDSANTGMIGLCPGDFSNIINQPKFENGIIDILPHKEEYHNWGIGMLFFITKKNWVPIPEEIRIWYGDNFVVDNNRLAGRQNYIIANSLMYTPYSATVRDMISEYEDKDRKAYEKIYADLVNKYKV